jgi:hypothetical protein
VSTAALAPLRTCTGLAPASEDTLAKIRIVHDALLEVADVKVDTEHLLHGGMYVRTIRFEPGIVSVGSLIKRPTVLIVNGPCAVMGPDGWVELTGYNVLPGSSGRKMLRVTRGHVELTMIVATEAKTVEEAENEVFAEADILMSRRGGGMDTITITGE